MAEVNVPRLKKHYNEVVVKQLTEQFGYTNRMQVPQLERLCSTWALAMRSAIQN